MLLETKNAILTCEAETFDSIAPLCTFRDLSSRENLRTGRTPLRNTAKILKMKKKCEMHPYSVSLA